MELTGSSRRKADPMLQATLEQASADDRLRVILTLERRAPEGREARPSQADHSQRRRQRARARALREADRKWIELLGLRVLGQPGPTCGVFVEGSAREICGSLERREVLHASMDRELPRI